MTKAATGADAPKLTRYQLLKQGKMEKCPQCGHMGARAYETDKCGEQMPVWECDFCENNWPREIVA